MYSSFEVRGFRCFEKLVLPSLARVNLIAGVNNIGKTSLLEALFIHCGAYNPTLTLTVNGLRGISNVKLEFGSPESPWDSLFPRLDTSRVVELVGDGRTLRLKVVREAPGLSGVSELVGRPADPQAPVSSLDVAKVVELEYKDEQRTGRHYLIIDRTGIRAQPAPPPPPFPGFFLGARVRPTLKELGERYSKLELRGDQALVLDTLKVIEPQLERVALLYFADQPVLHGDAGWGLVPLPLMGGGMVCLAEIAIHVGNAKGGVLLIDEIENGLHHSVLREVWRVLGEAARRFDAQVFATTHSMECIIAAQQAFAEEGHAGDFLLHRLERATQETRVVTYDPETLGAAIEMGLEVR
ncbi:MAG: AAA family ATPase [Acetobacteraceae bacterium]|nr:AAA family ATPase [Acetobacteraceae bacterium]